MITANETPMRARPPFSSLALRGDEFDLSRPRTPRSSDRLKIAMLVPLSGPAGLWGPSCQTSATLASHEVNAAGGILGREIELASGIAADDRVIVAPPDGIADGDQVHVAGAKGGTTEKKVSEKQDVKG